jgi:uncharacterized protein YkwD
MTSRFSGKLILISTIFFMVQCPKNPEQTDGFGSKEVRQYKTIDANGRVVTRIVTTTKDKNGVRHEKEEIIEGDVPFENQLDFKRQIKELADKKVVKPVEKAYELKPDIKKNEKLAQNEPLPPKEGQKSNGAFSWLFGGFFGGGKQQPKEGQNGTQPIVQMNQKPSVFKAPEGVPLTCGKAVLSAVNAFRQKNGHKKVDWSDVMYANIINHTESMTKTATISHNGFDARITKINKDLSPSQVKIIKPAENVAMTGGFTDFQPELADKIVSMWIKSPGHNANMQLQNANYAAVDCQYSSKSRAWYATLFIAEVGKAILIL